MVFRKAIAIIDDDLNLLHFLKEVLETENIEVHTFTTHREALEKVNDLYPGIVIIDYQMADGDGVSLLKQMKELLPQAKVIMLTGEGNELVAVQAMKAGASDYLVKPIHPPQFLEIVHHYFKEYFGLVLDLNHKYDYPIQDPPIARYEFLRAAYSGVSKSVKSVCQFFTFSRQDFYNYDKRFRSHGVAGLFKKKDFEKLPERYQAPNPRPTNIGSLAEFIDKKDDVQIKLEMMRAAATDPKPNICEISQEFGYTREAFYQIYRRFQNEGLVALTEKKKGRPRKNA